MTGRCCDPKAPMATCSWCGALVHTCELKVPIGNDYRCPAHPDGVELSDGRWACCEACYDKLAGGAE